MLKHYIPNFSKQTCLFLVAAILWGISAYAGSRIYVSTSGSSAGPGGQGSPFALPTQAISASSSGDTIVLMNGVYNESTDIIINKSLVLIKNNPSGNVTIDASNRPVSDSLKNIISIQNASHVIIDGLRLQNCIGYGARGILVRGSGDSIFIRNCTIRNIGWISNNLDSLPAATNVANAVLVEGNAQLPLTNVFFSGNRVSNCATGTGEGVTFTGYVRNSVIEGNIIDSISNIGIGLAGNYWYSNPTPGLTQVKDIIVRKNKVSRCMSGRAISGGIYMDGSVDCIIDQNEISECGVGISVGAEQPSLTGTLPVGGHIIRNNKVHHNVSTGIIIGGFQPGMVRNISVSNNSFFHNGTGAVVNGIDSVITLDGLGHFAAAEFGSIHGGEINLANADTVLFQHNLVYPRSGRKHIVVSPGVNIKGIRSDYNHYYRDDAGFGMVISINTAPAPLPPPPPTSFNGAVYAGGFTGSSLQEYRDTTGMDLNSSYGPPMLTDTMLHNYMPLPGSPLIDAGSPVFDTLICGALDITDSSRLFGLRVDIGAYENRSVSTGFSDAAYTNSNLLLFPNPTSGLVMYNTTKTIRRAVVRNVLGRIMLIDNRPKGSIDLSRLPEGIYFVELFDTENNRMTSKIWKKEL